MGRRNDEPRKKVRNPYVIPGTPNWLAVPLLCVAMGVVMVVGTIAVVIVREAIRTPGKPLATRDEVRAILVGKSEDEVVKLLGNPTRKIIDLRIWCYTDIAVDPATGRTDRTTYVEFEYGRVTRVSFVKPAGDNQ